MIELTKFGTDDGTDITCATLTSEHLRAEILSFGAITKSLTFKGQEMVLGYATAAEYLRDPFSMGIIAGRCANRIRAGRFTLDGKTHQLSRNLGAHHLHGGAVGFGKRHWTLTQDAEAVVLSLISEDGDQGYPARVEAKVRIWIEGATLVYQMQARADAPTIINLAQHNYYDLGGAMRLSIDADRYTVLDQDLVATGEIAPVTGALDFRTPKEPPADLDINYVLRGGATIYGQNATLDLTTDQPGLQAYAGIGLTGPFRRNQGLCLEPQLFPNAINIAGFDQPVYGPGRDYAQTTRIRFRDAQV